MIEIFAAGNVDNDNPAENVPFSTREEARLFCQLEFEHERQTDSANFAVTFQRPTEEQIRKLTVCGAADMHEFLVLSTGEKTEDGSWYWFVRTEEVYEDVSEYYRVLHALAGS